MLASTLTVQGTSISLWVLLAVVVAALLIGFALGLGSGAALGRRGDGKPWWYEVAFPSPDETTVGALKVLADRYALGEINADEFRERVAALRNASETPEQRKQRFEQEARATRKARG